MSFKEFMEQAWNDHGTQAEGVARRFADAIQLVTEGEQIAPIAKLITHVMGEHLGRWDEGIRTLAELRNALGYQKGVDAESVIARSIASLELASGERSTLIEFSLSDQVQILSVASAALSGRGLNDRALELFQKSQLLAGQGLPSGDPAHRALAVAGNNLACELESLASRTSIEEKLMILAAQTARTHWEIAGGWLQVERAEYRLAQSHLKAGDLDRALEHARACLAMVKENNAPALEFFFGYEVLALVELARNDLSGFTHASQQVRVYFEQLTSDDQTWCEATLKKIESLM